MIFMLFSTSYSLFQENAKKLEYHAHETWPRTCDPVVFWLCFHEQNLDRKFRFELQVCNQKIENSKCKNDIHVI
jgi:hypothetical protein